MKVSSFISPYQANGKTNYLQSANRAGVYLIKENAKLVYVGFSGTNLYRTMYRHFQRWNHSAQEVVTYFGRSQNKYTVRVIHCTARQAVSLEKALIIKYRPRDNENKYRGYKMDIYDQSTVETYNETDPEPFVIPF